MNSTALIASLLCVSVVYAQTIFLEEDFSTESLSAGWTRTSLGTPTAGWEFGSSLQIAGFPIPSHGSYAACNDNLHDNAIGTANDAYDDRLRTPLLNLSGATSVVVEFDYFNISDASGNGAFIVSTTGGATWSFTFMLSEVGVWEHFQWELLSWSANTMIGFRYMDGGTSAFGLAIENLVIYQPESNQAGLNRPYTSSQMPLSGGFIGGEIHNYG